MNAYFRATLFQSANKNLNQNRCSIQSLIGTNSVFFSIKKSPFFMTLFSESKNLTINTPFDEYAQKIVV